MIQSLQPTNAFRGLPGGLTSRQPARLAPLLVSGVLSRILRGVASFVGSIADAVCRILDRVILARFARGALAEEVDACNHRNQHCDGEDYAGSAAAALFDDRGGMTGIVCYFQLLFMFCSRAKNSELQKQFREAMA